MTTTHVLKTALVTAAIAVGCSIAAAAPANAETNTVGVVNHQVTPASGAALASKPPASGLYAPAPTAHEAIIVPIVCRSLSICR